MTIWFIFALMTGGAVFAVLWPLSRKPRPAVAAAVDDVAFYRQQLADIDSEVARGMLAPTEGEAVRVEAARRLLRATGSNVAGEGDQRGEPALRRRRAASAIAISVIPLVALALYGAFGRPDIPDAPLAQRLMTGDPRSLDINEAVARVEGHLARQPDDGRGWEVLGPIYLRAGRFADAARAWGEAVRLNGATPARLAEWGEAMVMAEQGVVTADARAVFERVAAQMPLDAANPVSAKAAYYLAIAREQDGDRPGAITRLRELYAAAPQDTPWRAAVAARIAAFEGGNDSASSANDPARSEMGRAIANLAPEERQQAIRGMVAQLAARIEEPQSTLEDWLRLIRSYAVLGEKAQAAAALQAALKRFHGDGRAQANLDSLATQLGIEQKTLEPQTGGAQ